MNLLNDIKEKKRQNAFYLSALKKDRYIKIYGA